jgi:hypothetical protein
MSDLPEAETKTEYDDLEYKVDENPWNVQQLEDFLFFCCPECDNKSTTREIFIDHAVRQHPLVR